MNKEEKSNDEFDKIEEKLKQEELKSSREKEMVVSGKSVFEIKRIKSLKTEDRSKKH